MIIDIPVPYHGFAVLPGKRNEDACLLVAKVPVQIPDAPAGSLDLAARITVPQTQAMTKWADEDPVARPVDTVDYLTDGEGLFAPIGLRNPRNTLGATFPHAPTPPDQFARIGLGGTAFRIVRGGMADGGIPQYGGATGLYNSRGRYPFATPAMNRHHWDGSRDGIISIHPETADLRLMEEAEPGARDAAIAFARRAASEMLAYQGAILERTPGPVWRSLHSHMPNQGAVVFLTATDDPWARFLPARDEDDGRWASFVSPVLEGEARTAFEASGHAVVHVGGIEVMRPDVFVHDTAGLGLVDAARGVTNPSTGVNMLAHAPADLGMAWFELRDAVSAIPRGDAADARLVEAATRFNALSGPERTDLWMAGYAAAAPRTALLPGR